MADEEKEEREEAPTGGKSKILLFVIIGFVVVLLAGGAAGYVMLAGSSPDDTESADAEGGEDHPKDEHETAEATGEGKGDTGGGSHDSAAAVADFYSLEPFIVNIDDGDKDRFLKLKVDLEVSSKEVAAELEQRLPQVKDIMIGLLSGQSFSDIRSTEGKDYLREELQTRLNAVVRKGIVRQVFFTEFVVQ